VHSLMKSIRYTFEKEIGLSFHEGSGNSDCCPYPFYWGIS
jgi:hypothetical protein